MRTTLRSAALGAGRVRAIPARSIATSSPRRADHSHDSHSHGHNDISDAVTHESWLSSPWRNTFIITALAYVAYNYLPVGKASTPSTTAAEERAEYARTDASAPLVTRLIAKYTEDAKDLRQREKEHIESVSQHADSRIITMNAETPKVRQFRDPNSLYTASPYGIPVGAQADLSGFEWK